MLIIQPRLLRGSISTVGQRSHTAFSPILGIFQLIHRHRHWGRRLLLQIQGGVLNDRVLSSRGILEIKEPLLYRFLDTKWSS